MVVLFHLVILVLNPYLILFVLYKIIISIIKPSNRLIVGYYGLLIYGATGLFYLSFAYYSESFLPLNKSTKINKSEKIKRI